MRSSRVINAERSVYRPRSGGICVSSSQASLEREQAARSRLEGYPEGPSQFLSHRRVIEVQPSCSLTGGILGLEVVAFREMLQLADP